MKKHLIILTLIGSQLAFSQITSNTGAANMSDGLSLRQTDIKGSPFFIDDWRMGSVINIDGSFKDQKELIYNLFNNNLFLKIGEGAKDYMSLEYKTIAGFILYSADKTQSFVFTKISGNMFEDSKDDEKFYEQASPQSKKVIVEHLKIFKDPNASGWTSSRYNNKGGEFNDISKVYVLAKDGIYYKISVKEKSLLSLFKDKKDELEDFIKNKNIKIKDAIDLVPIVEFYHQ